MNRESVEGRSLIALSPGASPKSNATRNSLSTSTEKAIPNYLRASTSSCHNFCKYGRNHSFDLKERHPIRHRRSKSDVTSTIVGSTAKEWNSKGVKTSLARIRASSTLKPTLDEKIKEEILEIQPSTLPKKDVNEDEDIELRIPVIQSESLEYENFQINNASTLQESNSVGNIESGLDNSPSVIHELCSTSAVVTESSMQAPESESPIKECDSSNAGTVKKGLLILSKHCIQTKERTTQLVRRSDSSTKSTISTGPKPKTIKQIAPIGKTNPPLKAPSVRKLTPTPLMNTKSSPKSSVTRSATSPKKLRSPTSSSNGLNVTPLAKMKSPSKPSKVEGKKVWAPSSVTPSSKLPTKRATVLKVDKPGIFRSSGSSKNQKKIGGAPSSKEVRDKTIDKVEFKESNTSSGWTLQSNSSPHSLSLSLSSLSSLSSHDGGDSGHAFDGGRELNEEEVTKGKERILKRPGSGSKQERAPTPYKLKFRKGRTVNIQPESSTGPASRDADGCARIKFQPKGAVGSSPDGKEMAHRRSSLRRKLEAASEDSDDGSVVLRHQTIGDSKKGTQAWLLNHVIEETASKLVKTRKSKVKALVGAFESVISLQETKPV